jgi:AmmeMemoRadiSam system protein B
MRRPLSQPDGIEGSIRHSVIAGSWYPGSERSLARAVDGYLARVAQAPDPGMLIPGKLLGLISPHAGYTYSGQTAAYAYHQLHGHQIDTVVLLGPSHRAWVGDYATNHEDAYETPLGLVPLDHAFIKALDKRISLPRVRRDAEHSLEIQLPFLQRQLGDFRVVPIMMNADDPAAARQLATALTETIQQLSSEDCNNGCGRALLVASSDLHHIEDYDEVVRRDQRVVDAIAAYDLEALTSLLMAPACSVCGRIPILTVLHAAKALGADSTRVLHHTNSGDVTGQRRSGHYTVGYMSAAIYKTL